jgi:transposase
MGYTTAIGLDVHARSISAAALIVTTGEVRRARFGYDAASVGAWMEGLPQPACAVYESGVTGFDLYRALNAHREGSCIIGAVSKMFVPAADRARKTDKRDALFLARMLACRNIVEVYVPPVAYEAARDLSRARQDAKLTLRQATQRLSQFLVRHGHIWDERTKSGSLAKAWGSSRYAAWLDSIHFTERSDAEAYAYYVKASQDAQDALDGLGRLIATLAQSAPFKGMVDALRCLKGIDTLSAFAFASEVADFTRFKSAPAFASWLGLCPSEHSSGERRNLGDITRCGNSHLRTTLCECAWSYTRAGVSRKRLPKDTRVDPAIQAHAHKGALRLIRFRSALTKRGKQASKANVACAREMAGWIWSLGCMEQRLEEEAGSLR